MAYYQDRQVGLPGVDYREVTSTDGEYDTYNYSAEPTAGWANDRVFPYHRGTDDGSAYGYVWVTEWDTTEDADEFEAFYRSILDAHDAERLDNGTYRIEDGRFADAFRVETNGTRVTIVNGPTPGAIGSIRPDVAASTASNGTATTTTTAAGTTTAEPTTAAGTTTTEPTTAAEDGTETVASDANRTTDGGGTTGASSPGFGPFAALAALAALLAGVGHLARRRTRRRR
jgi:hypothetical protein